MTDFKEGDRVEHHSAYGTVTAVGCCIAWDHGGSCWLNENTHGLRVAPQPLPDDHIDRHWIVGAWITCDEKTYLVISDQYVRLLWHAGTSVHEGTRYRTNLRTGGWSFHKDSPIKTKREVMP